MSLVNSGDNLKFQKNIENLLNDGNDNLLRMLCFEIGSQRNIFHILIEENCDLAIIEKLINKFSFEIIALMNHSNKFAISPFHLAIIMKRSDIVNYSLKEKIIDLEKKCIIDQKELNILEFANQQNNLEAVTAIVKARINMIEVADHTFNEKSLLEIIFFSKKLAFKVLKNFISQGRIADLQDILDLEFYDPRQIKRTAIREILPKQSLIHCYCDFFVNEEQDFDSHHLKTLEFILSKNPDLNKSLNISSENAMHYLARRFDKDVFRLITQHPNFNHRSLNMLDCQYRTPLDLSVTKCNIEAFEAMIDLQEINALKQYLPRLNHYVKKLKISHRSNNKNFPKKYRTFEDFTRLCNSFYIALDRSIMKKELQEFKEQIPSKSCGSPRINSYSSCLDRMRPILE